MSRSVLLSAGADVCLSDFVLSLWEKYWYDEIDVMYVGYNNHANIPKEIVYEFLRKWEKEKKVRIIYTPIGIGNGDQTTQMLFNSKEDLVLLLENDNFIFTSSVVDNWFSIIEQEWADVVGSPRYAAGEVADAAKRRYSLDYSGIGDKGFAWWPSFFVCKRRDLLQTDLDFGSKKYAKDEYFKELDHAFTRDCYTDTFAWTSIQLRYSEVKSFDIPQNHAHPYDLENKQNKSIMFQNGDPLYIHGGSLSSGWGGYLNTIQPPMTTDMEKQDMETRVAFWKIVSDNGKGYDSFRNQYQAAIQRLIVDSGLDRERINQKVNLYSQLMHV